MSSGYHAMKNHGLLNVDSGDLGSYATWRGYNTVAYCSSQKCAGNSTRGVRIAQMAERRDTCPDCGHYLVYRKTQRIENVNANNNYTPRGKE